MTGTATQRNVFLVPATLPAIRDACTKNPGWLSLPWLYLSRDALLRRRIATDVSHGVRFVDIGDRLQDAAHASRQEYIDFIGELSATYNSPGWWLTSVSEKNPFVSHLFLYICYLAVLEQELAKGGDLVVVCDSAPLIDAIQDSFGSRDGVAISVHGSGPSGISSRAGSRLRGLVRKSVFATRFISRILVATIFRLLRPGNFSGGDGIFIHSWTDSRSFARPSVYTDTYFGQLADTIKARYPGTTVISNVLPTLWYPKAVLSLVKCSDRVRLFENYLSIADVFRALAMVRSQLPDIAATPPFRQFVLTAIIRDAIHADRTGSARAELCALHLFAGRRLGREGRPRAVLATFENHMWEKMFWTGIRESGAGCRCIGYAHSIVSPWYLFYSLAAAERQIAPVPDYILVNGLIAQERLAAAGFDPATIRVCGAFRYAGPAGSGVPVRLPDTEKTVLVVPTSGLNETIELVDQAVHAFRASPNIRVKIKLHPTTPAATVLPLYRDLPPQFSFTDEPVGILLKSADLVLFTESAVSIEALAASIPVLRIRSSLRIDMNIFDGIGSIPSASAPAEIAQKAQELFAGAGTGARYDSLVRSFFAAPDEGVVTDLLSSAPGERK